MDREASVIQRKEKLIGLQMPLFSCGILPFQYSGVKLTYWYVWWRESTALHQQPSRFKGLSIYILVGCVVGINVRLTHTPTVQSNCTRGERYPDSAPLSRRSFGIFWSLAIFPKSSSLPTKPRSLLLLVGGWLVGGKLAYKYIWDSSFLQNHIRVVDSSSICAPKRCPAQSGVIIWRTLHPILTERAEQLCFMRDIYSRQTVNQPKISTQRSTYD